MMIEGGLSIGEIGCRVSIPKSTLNYLSQKTQGSPAMAD